MYWLINHIFKKLTASPWTSSRVHAASGHPALCLHGVTSKSVLHGLLQVFIFQTELAANPCTAKIICLWDKSLVRTFSSKGKPTFKGFHIDDCYFQQRNGVGPKEGVAAKLSFKTPRSQVESRSVPSWPHIVPPALHGLCPEATMTEQGQWWLRVT